ncbi:hypothetical protein ACJX0J_010564, partial [Zea mays]
ILYFVLLYICHYLHEVYNQNEGALQSIPSISKCAQSVCYECTLLSDQPLHITNQETIQALIFITLVFCAHFRYESELTFATARRNVIDGDSDHQGEDGWIKGRLNHGNQHVIIFKYPVPIFNKLMDELYNQFCDQWKVKLSKCEFANI